MRLLYWLLRGLVLVLCLAVAASVAVAQTVSPDRPWWLPLLSWSGVTALVVMIGQWALRGHVQKEQTEQLSGHTKKLEELSADVAERVSRLELERTLERVEERIEKRVDRFDAKLDGLFRLLGSRNRLAREDDV